MASSEIRRVSLDALLCRGQNNHHWELYVKARSEAYTPQRKRRAPQFGQRWVYTCRCKSERADLVNEHGDFIEGTRGYDYSPEYELALEFTRQEARVEMQRRDRQINSNSQASGR